MGPQHSQNPLQYSSVIERISQQEISHGREDGQLVITDLHKTHLPTRAHILSTFQGIFTKTDHALSNKINLNKFEKI